MKFERIRNKVIGRRGACLTILGLMEVVIGFSTWNTPSETLMILPLVKAVGVHTWGAAQMIIGLLAMCFVFAQTPDKDRYGFTIAQTVPLFWLCAWISSVIPFFGGTLDLFLALRQAFIWFGYFLLIFIVSGMMGYKELMYHKLRDEEKS